MDGESGQTAARFGWWWEITGPVKFSLFSIPIFFYFTDFNFYAVVYERVCARGAQNFGGETDTLEEFRTVCGCLAGVGCSGAAQRVKGIG